MTTFFKKHYFFFNHRNIRNTELLIDIPLPEDDISVSVGLPGLHQSKIPRNGLFQDEVLAVKLSHLHKTKERGGKHHT